MVQKKKYNHIEKKETNKQNKRKTKKPQQKKNMHFKRILILKVKCLSHSSKCVFCEYKIRDKIR